MSQRWVEIDGSEGEGGGQMLRTGLALSLLTTRPVRIVNIRAKRPRPGLQAQHLACVHAATAICGATVTGNSLGSRLVSFVPGPVQSGEYHFEIGTAGATALVLHTVYLPLLLKGQGPSLVRIKGGTHALAAPSGEFLTMTWQAYLRILGAGLEVNVVRPGFFPKGGGIVQAKFQPSGEMRPFEAIEELTSRENVVECHASLGGGLPASIGQRMMEQVKKRLGTDFSSRVTEYPHSKSPGVVLNVIDCRGRIPAVFSALGVRGKPAEQVADEAVDEYLAHRQTGCAVDPHSADQLVLPLAFVRGPSLFRVSAVTGHLLTQRDVMQHFIDRRIEIAGKPGEPGEVKISS